MGIEELEKKYKQLEREKIESETKYSESMKTLKKDYGIESIEDAEKELKLVQEELNAVQERINEKTIKLEKLLESD